MTWLKVLLTCWFSFGVIATISSIGKPRGPMTPGMATATMVITSLTIWAVWLL